MRQTDRPARLDILTFGETMIRLAPAGRERLEVAEQLEVGIGGTEANLAIALARLGRRAGWWSALPDNPLGRRIAGELRRHCVDTSVVIWRSDARAGVYFLEVGASPRPTRVIYDRERSAIALLDPDWVDPGLVAEARLLHLSGITPALSPGCAEVCRRLAVAASEHGVPLSFDVNYRALLWSPDEARAGLQPMLNAARLIFCGAADAETIWELSGDGATLAAGLLDRSGAEVVVVTLGERGAVAMTRAGDIHEQAASPVQIVDPVGAGDAFAAGFLHRWLDDATDLAAALRSGVALASLSMTMPGDLAIVTPDELAAAEQALAGIDPDIVR